MKGSELKKIRLGMGLSQTEFAATLGYKRYQTITEYETDKKAIPERTAKLLKAMKEGRQK